MLPERSLEPPVSCGKAGNTTSDLIKIAATAVPGDPVFSVERPDVAMLADFEVDEAAGRQAPGVEMSARPDWVAPSPSFTERIGRHAMLEVGKEFLKQLPLADLGISLVQKSMDYYKEKKIKDIQDFASEVARQVADEGAEFGKAFESAMERPESNDATRRGLKAAMEIDEPEVLQALAHMTGRYACEGKRPDMFFKGFVRVCEQAGPEDYKDLKHIAAACREMLATSHRPLREGEEDKRYFKVLNASHPAFSGPTTSVELFRGEGAAVDKRDLRVSLSGEFVNLLGASGLTQMNRNPSTLLTLSGDNAEKLGLFLLGKKATPKG